MAIPWLVALTLEIAFSILPKIAGPGIIALKMIIRDFLKMSVLRLAITRGEMLIQHSDYGLTTFPQNAMEFKEFPLNRFKLELKSTYPVPS
jgi:hypothetical protein